MCASIFLSTSIFLDQLFSRIAEYLRKHDAYDRQGILDAIEYGFAADQYEKAPIVENLDRAANVSEWITPYLAPTPNVTQFRQFKLEKIEGKVCVSGRSRCSEEAEFNAWHSLDQTPGSSQVSLVTRVLFYVVGECAYLELSCRYSRSLFPRRTC